MNPSRADSLLLSAILQFIVIVASARAAGSLFRLFGQPRICGEIAAGLLLGPSFFGLFYPHLYQSVFNPAVAPQVSLLSEVGLIFVMLLIGLDFNFSHLRGGGQTALSISAAGIVVPFGLGQLLAPWVYSWMNLHVDALGFALFMSTAMSITAIPVLGRIMIEFNIHRTRIGALTITASAMDDACGWLLLAAVSAAVRSQLQPLRLTISLGATVIYLLIMLYGVRPLLRRWVRWVMAESGGELSLNAFAQILVFVFASAAVTSMIGIFPIFGAFVMGGVLFDQAEFRKALGQRLRDFVEVFFLPIFFTFTGLRTDIGSLHSRMNWLACGIVIFAATAGKFGACTLAARFRGFSWHEASAMGIMMNTRGLMELIVLNTGYDLGIIPRPVFSMLVIMSIATTYMTAPILRCLIPRTEMKADYEASRFVREFMLPS